MSFSCVFNSNTKLCSKMTSALVLISFVQNTIIFSKSNVPSLRRSLRKLTYPPKQCDRHKITEIVTNFIVI